MADFEQNNIRVRASRDSEMDLEEELLSQQEAMHREKTSLVTLGVIAVVLVFLAMILPVGIFYAWNTDMTLSVLLDRIASNFDGLVGVFVGNGEVFESRFMAVIVCAVSGAALGMCGSAYQGAFNNPLAAPKTLGVMAGGALGAFVYVVFLMNLGPQMPGSSTAYTTAERVAWLASLTPIEWLWVNYGQCFCSILGCFVSVGIVVGITSVLQRGKLTNITVIIFGQVFAAAVTALISFSRYWFSMNGSYDIADALKQIENYTMMSSFFYYDLLVVVLPIVICMVIVLSMGRRMTLLSFGDDEAAAMGVNVNRTRYAMIIICTIMVAMAISFCGHVAFLGFISAHLARRIVGPNFKYLLPASMFTGGALLTVVQYLCQSGLPFMDQNAAGSLTSVIGAALFIGMVIVQWRKGAIGEWK